MQKSNIFGILSEKGLFRQVPGINPMQGFLESDRTLNAELQRNSEFEEFGIPNLKEYEGITYLDSEWKKNRNLSEYGISDGFPQNQSRRFFGNSEIIQFRVPNDFHWKKQVQSYSEFWSDCQSNSETWQLICATPEIKQKIKEFGTLNCRFLYPGWV